MTEQEAKREKREAIVAAVLALVYLPAAVGEGLLGRWWWAAFWLLVGAAWGTIAVLRWRWWRQAVEDCEP